MKNILFIHQSAELYGSDKTILMFISSLDKKEYRSVVVLPFDGPLKKEFEKNDIKVVIAPVLKLYRKMFSIKNLIKFIEEYFLGMKELNKLHKEYDFDIVYSHTLASLIGILFARKKNIKHLWHVQEIIAQPSIVNKLFKSLLSWKYNHVAIYDSKETMLFWTKENPKLASKSDFIWNGLDVNQVKVPSPEEVDRIRKTEFLLKENEIIIGLFGRINSWKGQPLLLEAFCKLSYEYPDVKLVYIGSAPPNQEFFEIELKSKIKEYALEDKVILIPFKEQIWAYWHSLDIAVVPSTEPEPFGMVAIEAMMAQKPVVAANHGGLTEIVIPEETGYLFQPNDSVDLKEKLISLVTDKTKRDLMGKKGQQRVLDFFTLEQHKNKFVNTFDKLLN